MDKAFGENKNEQNIENIELSVQLPHLDSNQDKQNQNLSYYRYTMGHCRDLISPAKIGY